MLPLTVLPHMRQPLLDWLNASCAGFGHDEYWPLLAQMLKIDYTGSFPYQAIINAVSRDNDLLLDLVDARLQLGNCFHFLDDLALRLAFAGSGWRMNQEKDGLEQVVDEEVRAIAMAAVKAADASASHHLKLAWAETYGKDRNPTQAHAEMIRAVESAARPTVTPNDARATLGTIIGQLGSQGHLYTTAGESGENDGIASVVAMMQVLWQQQTDRHGANPTLPATQARVEFLLPIAAALVHALSTGAVRRR